MTSTLSTSLPSLLDVMPVLSEPLLFSRKTLIYTQGAPALFFIRSGAVRVFSCGEDGVRTNIDFYGAGHFFGLSIFESEPRHDTAVAHSDCELLSWSAATVATLMEARPEVGRALLRASVEHGARMIERAIRAERLKLRENVWATLLAIAARIGEPLPNGSVRIAPGITHEVLSECIGTSREIVTSNLNVYRKLGNIDFSRKEMILWRHTGTLKRKQAAA